MLLFKLILYLNIFLICSCLGFLYGERYSLRLKGLNSILETLRLLEMEILVFANPLPYALENVSGRVSREFGEILNMLKGQLNFNQTGDLYTSFVDVSPELKRRYNLRDEDINAFLSIGKVIGKSSRTDQERQFNHIQGQLELLISEAREERKRNGKMYRSLGVLTGLGMIIILA